MEIANRERYGLLAVVLLLLIRQYPVDLAIQNYVFKKNAEKASAITIATISSDAVFVLQNSSPASCSPAKTCLGIPLSSELVSGAFKQQSSRSLVERKLPSVSGCF